jgi:Domain of unknown function (DUF4288)
VRCVAAKNLEILKPVKKHTEERWNKNKSPVGWYVASLLMRLEWYDEQVNDSSLDSPCLAWENQILIKADNPKEAYAKAIDHGKLGEESGEIWEVDNEERKGRWKFEGLTSLLPIYDELEDGAEIAWTEYEDKSVRKIKSWIKEKQELEIFGGD